MLLCRTNCPLWTTSSPPVSWCLHVIPTKTYWAVSPTAPAKDLELSIQWQNSPFLILLGCYHHQIRLRSWHGLPCPCVKPAIQQLLPFLSKVLCIQILLWIREYTLSELHGFYHLSISHFQYVSVALMEKYESPPVAKIIPLISHRW